MKIAPDRASWLIDIHIDLVISCLGNNGTGYTRSLLVRKVSLPR